MVNILHTLRKRLVQLNDVCTAAAQSLLHPCVETRVHMCTPELQLLHHRFKRIKPTRKGLRSIGEGLDEPSCIGLSEETDDESLCGECGYPGWKWMSWCDINRDD